jgi:phosphatidylserine/phosphatidylglycerophosphate/cardiolipin synthase-like enzyme
MLVSFALLATVSLVPLTARGAATRPQLSVTPSVKQARLSLITEPGPGDHPFLRAVQGARSSVEVVMYELSDPTLEQALANARKRGVNVRVLLSGGYYGEGSSFNKAAYRKLRETGVAVRWSPSRFALTHQKTLVVDDRMAYIMTLNLVTKDYPTSRDFAVADTDKPDLSAIEKTFDADWNNRYLKPPHGVDLVWSPGAFAPELSLINSARHTIDIYNEEMDDSDITDALQAAARRGVDVKVVMTDSSDWNSAFNSLIRAGAHVRTYAPDASLYIHAKMILVDGRRAFLGSQNFSPTSLDFNRELGIILSSGTIIHSLQSTFGHDYANATTYRRSPTSGKTCRVSADWDTHYRDWNVYVHGPADVQASATADGYSAQYPTDSSGYADIYLYAPKSAAGDTVRVTAGSARCTGRL